MFFAEGSLRKLWRQKFRQSSVSSLASTRFERALIFSFLRKLASTSGSFYAAVYPFCLFTVGIKCPRRPRPLNSTSGPLLLHWLCVLENWTAESFWPSNFSPIILPPGWQVKGSRWWQLASHWSQIRILGESYNPASNSSTPRTQTRSRSKVKIILNFSFNSAADLRLAQVATSPSPPPPPAPPLLQDLAGLFLRWAVADWTSGNLVIRHGKKDIWDFSAHKL